MKITTMNTVFCTPKKINQNNSNITTINFKGSEEDTFCKMENPDEIRKQELKKERIQFRNAVHMAMQRNDEEYLETLLTSELVTDKLLTSLKKDYQASMQYSWGRKPTEKIGQIIEDAIAQRDIEKSNNTDNLKQKYIKIKTDLKYSDDNYATSILKKTFKNKDTILLRIAIDTLKKNNKPYAQDLMNAHNELVQEEAQKLAEQITEAEIKTKIDNAKNQAVKDTVMAIIGSRA